VPQKVEELRRLRQGRKGDASNVLATPIFLCLIPLQPTRRSLLFVNLNLQVAGPITNKGRNRHNMAVGKGV